ncbi:MAG: dicarboxylate/amino acid:cation symporter [Saccharofermentans sp.]|nr:dicarboxylate/amino acid:cation symporter [Saccharofermentans sp.]
MANKSENKPKSKAKKKMSLTNKIFIGLILGLIVGVIFNVLIPHSYVRDTVFVDGIFLVIGNGFIKLMKMLVVPLVFCSLVCGASSIGDTKSLGKVGGKTIVFYLCTTALAVSVAIGVSNIINPGIGLDMSSIKAADNVVSSDGTSIVDTILNIIPDNPFASLANGTMLQVIFFALIVGILLAKMGERAELISNLMNQFNELMMEMTTLVMNLAPVGVFCMIAKTFANLGFDAFLPLLKYMLSVVTSLGVQLFFVYMLLLFLFTRLNPFKFLKKFFPVMAFAFSTSTSNATIPMNIDTLEEKIGVSRKISSFTIPLGATINMDGTSIMQGCAVVFAAQAYGIDLGPREILTVIATATLASIGTAGIPSVGLVTLSMVFASVGLPIEAIALIMGIDRILDMLRTAVNITGDAVCTTVVAYQNKEFDKKTFNS